ncbi:MAG: helix-turn-helix transcriptional regulator [Caulobacterales bacterium]
MSGLEDGELLDLIYDAALDPGLWTPVMERLVEMVDGAGAMLVDQNPASGEGAAIIVRHDPDVLKPYFGYYASRNVLMNVPDPRKFMSGWTPRILTDEDWIPKDELVRSEYYNDYLRTVDVHSVLFIRLAAHEMNAVNLNIGRPERGGQFSASDIDTVGRLHPHLIRSFKLGRKLAKSRQLDAAAEAFLDWSPYGVFILGQDGRLRHANRAAERLVSARCGLAVVGGRLCAAEPEATRRLQALVARAAASDAERRSGGSMALAAPGRRLPLSVMVAPLSAGRVDLFPAGPLVIVCVTDPEAGIGLPEQRLRDLFGLTAAEARVTLALVEGRTPREVAKTLGLSFYTVRAHLVRIFDKTGTSRQAELVRLLMRVIGVGLD